MRKIVFILSVALSSVIAHASPTSFADVELRAASLSLLHEVYAAGTILDDWKTGDVLNYKMRIKPFFPLKAYAKIQVSEASKSDIVLVQEMGYKKTKMVTEMTMDRATGEVKKLKVNGKDQKQSKLGANDTHVTVQEEAHLKVAAGEFDCVHTVMVDKNGSKTESWMNPRDLPITGMLKSVATTGLFVIELELVSFSRGP